MSTWYRSDMGDGIAAFAPSNRLHQLLLNYAAGGVPAGLAVFFDKDAERDIIWYFSPEAAVLAKHFDAVPCEKPAPTEDFGLLSGSQSAWEIYFPGFVEARRRRRGA